VNNAGTDIDVDLVFYDENNTLTTNQTLAKKYEYTITAKRLISLVSTTNVRILGFGSLT